MRKFQVLSVIGGIVLVIGIGGIFWAATPASGTETFTIPAGAEWYYVFEVNVLGGARLHVEFTAPLGQNIDVFVLDEPNYQTYINGGSVSAVISHLNAQGTTFDVTLPSTGKYYLAFDHGSLYESVDQEVRVTYRLNGIDPTFLVIGVVLIVVAAVLLILAARYRRKERLVRPIPPPPSGVVMFQPPKNP